MKHGILLPFMLATGPLFGQMTHSLTVENDAFDPEFLVVEAGDPIQLRLTEGHTLTEVSPSTFRAGGAVPNGGVHIGMGTAYDNEQAVFTLDRPGTYYFVSEGRDATPAKTMITVLPAYETRISPSPDERRLAVYPNPADDQVRFAAYAHLPFMTVEAFDQDGRIALREVVRGNAPLNILSLSPGHYTLRLTDGMSTVYGIERLIVNRGLGDS